MSQKLYKKLKEELTIMIKGILKGAVIGLANIIPGVSGGTMAVSMGIYDKLIHAVTHIRSEFKEAVKLLFPILLGALIGIGLLSFVITAAFDKFPVQTNFLFIGLIVGGMPIILRKLKETGKKVSIGNVIVLLIFFAIVVVMAAMGEAEGKAADTTINFVNIMKFFGVGVIASATMVIPGVSGSMVMMLMGYYNTIILEIKHFIEAAIHFDIDGMVHGFGILFPLGIGILLGIAVIAKLIELLFSKTPNYAYCAIIGLIVASPIGIILMSDLSRYNVLSVLTGAVMFVIGYFIALKLAEE